MEIDYPLDYEPATPEYVFEVLRSLFHESYVFPRNAPRRALETSMTIEDWFNIWDWEDDLFGWRHSAKFMNDWWNVKIPLDKWKPLLSKPKIHTVRDVCILLSSYVRQPRIRAATVLGRRSRSAAMFLTIRSLLNAAGANVDNLAPSTSLTCYRRYWRVFDREVRRLAPRNCPTLIASPTAESIFFSKGVVIGFTAMVLACLFASWTTVALTLALGGVVLALGSAVAAYLSDLGADRERAKMAFGDFRTFLDLAKHLVAKET